MERTVRHKAEVFSEWLANKVTGALSTMTCAGIFTCLAIYGAFGIDWHNPSQIVQWLSQTFIQLVALSILAVNQKVTARGQDKMNQEMHDAVLAEFAEIKQMHKELHKFMGIKK